MPMTITKEMHDHRTEAAGTVGGRIVSKNVGEVASGAGRYVPSEEAVIRQRARMLVNIPAPIKEMLTPIFRGRKGQQTLMEYAERLGMDPEDQDSYVFYWLSREPYIKGSRQHTVAFSPTDALLSKARKYCLSPHILVRAAAAKVALELHGDA